MVGDRAAEVRPVPLPGGAGGVRAGDPDAAARRLALVEEIPVLALTEDVEVLAREYLGGLELPARARIDVVHPAFAVSYELDYLLTWNCMHLANGLVIHRLQELNSRLGRRTPIIVTPDELQVPPEEG